MTRLRNQNLARAAGLALLLAALAAFDAGAQSSRQPVSPEVARQRDLERDAAVSLSLAKKSIQEDAFYNAKVALNVWRLAALQAGTFDRKLYDDLRKQLFEKSIRDNLRCIDAAVTQRDAPEANLCLRIYRLHAQEINAFDPRRYEDLRARVNGIRKKEK